MSAQPSESLGNTRPPPAWRRAWKAVHSKSARYIAMAAMSVGVFAAVGHFIGGMLGWWHLYESIWHKKPKAVATATAPQFSVVVLPLKAEDGSGSGSWFQDVLTADLTTELGRVSGSLVISRDTAATYAGKAIDPRQVAKELGVRYVVQGTAQRRDDRVRVELALVEGHSGAQKWAQQFDLDRARLAQGLEDIVTRIARSLSAEVYRAEGKRSGSVPLQDLAADDLAMQGWGVWFRGLTRESLQEAQSLFEAAVARDPRSIRGWGGVAIVNGTGRGLGWLPDREASLNRLREAVDRLQALDATDPFTLTARATLYNQEGNWEGALAMGDAMIERMPGSPHGHFNRGLMSMNLGRLEDCLEPTKRALRIGPRDPLVPLWKWQLATCHFLREEYPAAVDFARESMRENPKLVLPPVVLAASLARTGLEDEARAVVVEHKRLFPDFRLDHVSERYMRGSHERYAQGRERLVATARELGLP